MLQSHIFVAARKNNETGCRKWSIASTWQRLVDLEIVILAHNDDYIRYLYDSEGPIFHESTFATLLMREVYFYAIINPKITERLVVNSVNQRDAIITEVWRLAGEVTARTLKNGNNELVIKVIRLIRFIIIFSNCI